MAYECGDRVHVRTRETHGSRYPCGRRRTDRRVVLAESLADVMQQCADEQKIRTRHPANVCGRLNNRLHRMSVDGEHVNRMVLRQAPEPVPIGQPCADETVPIACLPDG